MGASRPLAWANYFSNKGYAVTVLTSKKWKCHGSLNYSAHINNGVKLIEVDFTLNKTKRVGVASRVLWSFFATIILLKTRRRENFDVVISTFGPSSSHFLGCISSFAFNCKWIADYRDLWSLNPYTKRNNIYKIMLSYFEKKLLLRAWCITTVSEPYMEKLEAFHNKKVYTIRNGFDSSVDFNYAKSDSFNSGNTTDINIVYTGNLYPGRRDPENLFKAISELQTEENISKRRLKISFYGEKLHAIEEKLKKYSIENHVTCMGVVGREESLRVQQNADILLFLDWPDPSADGTIPAKLFEYLSASRPILAIGVLENGSVSRILKETNAGILVENNVQSIKEFLLKLLRDGRTDWYSPKIEEIRKYDRNDQLEKLSNIIFQ